VRNEFPLGLTMAGYTIAPSRRDDSSPFSISVASRYLQSVRPRSATFDQVACRSATEGTIDLTVFQLHTTIRVFIADFGAML